MKTVALLQANKVPIRNGKPGKWEDIFQSGNFFNKLEKSGKTTQNTGSQGISGKCYLLLSVKFK